VNLKFFQKLKSLRYNLLLNEDQTEPVQRLTHQVVVWSMS